MSDSDISKLMIRIVLGCYTLFMLLILISLMKTFKVVALPLESLYAYWLITASHIAGMMFVTFLMLLTLECVSLRGK